MANSIEYELSEQDKQLAADAMQTKAAIKTPVETENECQHQGIHYMAVEGSDCHKCGLFNSKCLTLNIPPCDYESRIDGKEIIWKVKTNTVGQ